MSITKFEDITAWQKARELTGKIYEQTQSPEFRKDFGLVDQIRRASGSIMHNIAEGFDAGSNKEFVRFLRYSFRSASEVQSQLYIALDAGFISAENFDQLYQQVVEVKKLLGGFIKYLINKNVT
ncbi:four helix bundle protein [Verrucomicrobiaceae bacterium N1E253]|uniref:Four helix bundle protein n=1 Tax=Oceaniferula marina TaxID=2748318 RepID=A0A851GJA6_9BACT|nr:four helix bundle protein [Oceaniferula marina]NWK55187.1 four helix bundle protein [Oceaniferula marina]